MNEFDPCDKDKFGKQVNDIFKKFASSAHTNIFYSIFMFSIISDEWKALCKYISQAIPKRHLAEATISSFLLSPTLNTTSKNIELQLHL